MNTDELHFFTSDDGRTLAYSDGGAGVPLLCLAGLTRNMRDFEPVQEHFADRARIIRLDSRGRGLSEFDKDYQKYNVLQEANDALALLDHLRIDKAAVLGTSRGGLIAMTMGVGHKDRLLGVLLNDIGPEIEPAGLAYIFGYLGMKPGDANYDAAAERLETAMAPRFPGVTRAQWRIYAERLWKEGPDELELRYDPHLRRAVLEQSADDSLPSLWPLFEAFEGLPLALLRGANSDLLSPETAAKMREIHPEMLYAEVPDRGHVPFLDEPASRELIGKFLDMLT